jgi:hypothetical protein
MTDHVISNNLVVLGMSTFTGGQTFDGQMIVDLDNTEALLVRKDGDGGDVFIVDTVNDEVIIGSGLTLPTSSVDRLKLIGLDLTVNGTVGGSHSILLQGKTRTAGGVNHTSDWRILVTPISTTGLDGASILRFNGAIDGAAGSEVLRMEDNGRVAFIQPEQFSIGSASFIDNVQVHITGSFIDDYGGGPTTTHKLLIDGSQTGDAGRTARQTIVDVSGTSIITQNASQTVNEVGGMFIVAPNITPGTDTITIAYALKVSQYPTVGTENYGLLVDGTQVATNLTALVRIGKSFNQGVKLLVGGGVGFENIEGTAQMRLTNLYQPDGLQTEAMLLHVHSTLQATDGTTDHITGAFFEGTLRTQGDSQTIANISQVRIDEPNIQDNGDTITNAQSLLITGSPTEGVSNFTLRSTGAAPSIFAGLQFIIGDTLVDNWKQVFISGTFVSGGGAAEAAKFQVEAVLEGAAGDTTFLVGANFSSAVRTQTATEDVTDIAQVRMNAVTIFDNLTGSITNAQTLLITGAPTAGVNNYALRILGGDVQLPSAGALQWSTDLKLFRDGPWELALRDGLNDNFFYVYGTFTDSSNYERLALYAGSSVNHFLEPQSAGTGANDINLFIRALGSGNLTLGAASQTASVSMNGPIIQRTSPGTSANAQLFITTVTALLSTASGSSVTAAGLIPNGSLLFGVTTKVTTTITGPAGYDVGDGIDVDRWGNSIPVSAGNGTNISNFTSGTVTFFPSGNDVVISSDGVDFTGGEIRIIVHYLALNAPTS